MQVYKTVQEKAEEWGLSARHVQYLCRNGKIEGAVKRAGTWFILDDIPSPAVNSKSGAKDFNYKGTKKRIFNSSIELFMHKGFDNVRLRDIADKVGIQQSTIYNHFKSKQEILDAIYKFYCLNYLKNRLSLEEMEDKLQNESLLSIIGHMRYNFEEINMQKMTDITKIIFQRIAIDDNAREIAKSLMVDEGINYVETVLSRAIELGRFAPFDTHAMSIFINSVGIFTLYYWIIDPSSDAMMRILADEQNLHKYAANLIDSLYPGNAFNPA